MLRQGFGRSPAQNRGLGGDVRLKSGGHTCCCSYCYSSRSTKNEDLARTAKTTLLPQERYQLVVKRNLCCLPWDMHMYTYLPWPISAPSWPEGHAPQEEVFGGLCASKWHNEKQRERSWVPRRLRWHRAA